MAPVLSIFSFVDDFWMRLAPNKESAFISRVNTLKMNTVLKSGGYPVKIFTTVPELDLICGLCCKVLCKPYQCKNGHCFCFYCISTALEVQRECPKCKTYLDMDRIGCNVYLLNKINDLAVKCQNRFCGWRGSVEQLNSHSKCTNILYSFVNGDTYEGEWKNCKKDGVGEYKYANGDSYTGEFVANLKHGNGKYMFVNGSSYEGKYEHGMRHGKGFATNGVTGEIYSGVWMNDKFVGEAADAHVQRTVPAVSEIPTLLDVPLNDPQPLVVATAATSPLKPIALDLLDEVVCTPKQDNINIVTILEGDRASPHLLDFKNEENKVEEEVDATPSVISTTIAYSDGRLYTGEILNLKRHGCGVLTDTAGDVLYEGGWSDDQFQGHGSMSHVTAGCVVREEHKAGHIHEQKRVSLVSNALLYEGEFERNSRQGQGRLECHNGNVYEGMFYELDGRVVGRGSITYSDGQVYSGYLLDFQRHGRGVISLGNGWVKYSGEWLRDKPHGCGRYCFTGGHTYDGSFVHGVKEGQGILNLADGGAYNGEWKADKRHGRGRATYVGLSGRSSFEGSFRCDKRHGEGLYRYSDGSEYWGEWSDDQMHGQGCFTHRDGLMYTGEFVLNRSLGEGVIKFSNGSVYSGQVKNFKRNGQGRHVSIRGIVLKGPFVEDRLCGPHCVISYPDGSEYRGDCLDSLRHGLGVTTDKTRDTFYQGEWRADKMHGEGVMKYASGKVYEGAWEGGKRHGQGRLTRLDGDVMQCIWLEDGPHGEVMITSSDGSVYYGAVAGTTKHGHGTCKYANGDEFSGLWSKGLRHDPQNAVMKYADGSIYRGQFVHDLPHGQGVHIAADGCEYSGQFEKGLRHGLVAVKYPNGERYEGIYREGRRHGPGVKTSAAGDVVKGEFYEV